MTKKMTKKTEQVNESEQTKLTPLKDQFYYIPYLKLLENGHSGYLERRWEDSPLDCHRLSRGLGYLTKEDALKAREYALNFFEENRYCNVFTPINTISDGDKERWNNRLVWCVDPFFCPDNGYYAVKYDVDEDGDNFLFDSCMLYEWEKDAIETAKLLQFYLWRRQSMQYGIRYEFTEFHVD